SGRANFFQMLCDIASHFFRVLIWHQAARDFCAGPRRNDSLAAFALIATGQTVDLQRGPGRAAFQRAKTAFAEKSRHAQKLLIFALVESEAFHLLALEFG